MHLAAPGRSRRRLPLERATSSSERPDRPDQAGLGTVTISVARILNIGSCSTMASPLPPPSSKLNLLAFEVGQLEAYVRNFEREPTRDAWVRITVAQARVSVLTRDLMGAVAGDLAELHTAIRSGHDLKRWTLRTR